MKSITFDKKWEKLLRSGEKTVFVTRDSEYKHLDELEIRIGCEFMGYSKIIRIRKIEARELNNAYLSKCGITKYRCWIDIAHKFGYSAVPQLLEDIFSTWNLKDDDVLQIIEMLPIKNNPYNKGVSDGS